MILILQLTMAFKGVLNDAEVTAALDGCKGKCQLNTATTSIINLF